MTPALALVDPHGGGSVTNQIQGLITVYNDGHVDRPPIVPCVSSSLDPGYGVVSHDMVIHKYTNLWARLYVPVTPAKTKLPLVVYFHGGGFCVGSAAWTCYHHFLAKLSLKAKVVILSVNYRLAPENPLPAAYEDGFKTLKWIKQTSSNNNNNNTWRWTTRCDFSNVFLAGDSAGANIAHYLAVRLSDELEAAALRPVEFKGTILIQPFFGGQARTESEREDEDGGKDIFRRGRSRRDTQERTESFLSLAAADTYWRLALPAGADRDHPWCNPVADSGKVVEGLKKLRRTMVCVSERDILRDRNMEFCGYLDKVGIIVERYVYREVGHAFQILGKTEIAKERAEEMISHIHAFIFS